ncbi:hypothetical protein Cob_v001431 [Colletotrichum orbiculare MAFF 240422]|uniref:DUF7708 domain-containing protein n=1 Tax=Colletotrichum orbiculare (strain 104-T / ATCC 96160 / CBS 514.97 / LARS 414 / MAFF 240422) TaxID=1213857 RepID=N4UUC9_COLOR|nr:hypothetical protein Cob_v001431 [Colletotrichum orbiculare MAFF 240422]
MDRLQLYGRSLDVHADADQALLWEPRPQRAALSGTQVSPSPWSPISPSDVIAPLRRIDEDSVYSQWYTRDVQLPSFDPARAAKDKAVEILKKELTTAELEVLRLQERNSIQDVQSALDSALEEYQLKSKTSKARDWLSKCSSRVMYYAAVFDTFSQHHPEYVSLAWGAFKFLFIAVLNYEELLVEVSKAVSRIADALPRTELQSLLYPTPRMQDTVAQLYAKILEFTLMAIKFYKKGKLSHSILSVIKPFSLSFQPIIEEITERSRRVDQLASALSKAELRDLRIEFTRNSAHSDAEIRSLRLEVTRMRTDTLRLMEMMALQSQSFLSYQNEHKVMYRVRLIEQIQELIMLEDTPVADDTLAWCRSMRNRRRQKAPTQLPLQELSRLKSWLLSPESSLLLASGQGVKTSALDFAANFLDAILEKRSPVVWALPGTAIDLDGRADISMTGVLKSLISQALSINSDIVSEGINPLTAKHFKAATSIQQWFDILKRCVSSFKYLFLVIDASVIDAAAEHEEAETQRFKPGDFVEQMSHLISKKSQGYLKIVIASWKYSTISSIDTGGICGDIEISTDRGRRVERLMRQPKYRAVFRRRQYVLNDMLKTTVIGDLKGTRANGE